MRFNFSKWILALAAVGALIFATAVRAQDITNLPPVIATNMPAFKAPLSALGSLDSYLPTRASLGQDIEVRAGYGYNSSIHSALEVLAVEYTLAPALSLGGVFYRDNYGIDSGGVTMSINGSYQAPLVGELDFFGGEGIGYSFRFHKPVNYLFTGIERPFLIGKFRLAPGFSILNATDRPGTAFILGVSFGAAPQTK